MKVEYQDLTPESLKEWVMSSSASRMENMRMKDRMVRFAEGKVVLDTNAVLDPGIVKTVPK